MERLTSAIMNHVAALPEGTPISAKELLHLGSRAAVDQSLSRLVQRGQLTRAVRGRYVLPTMSRFGTRPPSVETVVRGLAASRGEIVAPHGAAAANALGLTTQVPTRSVYLTSGRNRRFKVGNQTIELRHAPAWQLEMAGKPAGEAIRALAWLGEREAPTAVERLRKRLPVPVLEEIASVRSRLPTWLAKQVSELVNHA
jgi:hypothetical protein